MTTTQERIYALLKENLLQKGSIEKLAGSMYKFFLGGLFAVIAIIPRLYTGIDAYGNPITTNAYIMVYSFIATFFLLSISTYAGKVLAKRASRTIA